MIVGGLQGSRFVVHESVRDSDSGPGGQEMVYRALDVAYCYRTVYRAPAHPVGPERRLKLAFAEARRLNEAYGDEW